VWVELRSTGAGTRWPLQLQEDGELYKGSPKITKHNAGNPPTTVQGLAGTHKAVIRWCLLKERSPLGEPLNNHAHAIHRPSQSIDGSKVTVSTFSPAVSAWLIGNSYLAEARHEQHRAARFIPAFRSSVHNLHSVVSIWRLNQCFSWGGLTSNITAISQQYQSNVTATSQQLQQRRSNVTATSQQHHNTITETHLRN
jgi:hypothetical protein